MVYTINTKLSKPFNTKEGDLAENGVPVKEALAIKQVAQKTFQHKAQAEMTASQLKELVKQKLDLPNELADVTIISNGKKVQDSDVVKSYTVVYTATLPKAVVNEAPVETTTEAPVETTTEAPVETTTEAPVETTTQAL